MLGNAFRTYLEVERNYSQNTVTAYSRDLSAFQSFLQETYELDPLSVSEVGEVTHRMIRSWMSELMEAGLSKRSVARKIASLNTYFKFLQKSERLEDNPAARVSVPRQEKKLPSVMKSDSIDMLFEQVEYPEGFAGLRDKCLLEVLYSCGLRRSELIGLEFRNIDFSNRTLKVMGKGRKERIIPFGEPAAVSMRAYLRHCDQEGINCRGIFFVRENGEALYPRLVHRVVEKYLQQACSLSKKSPHVLRHSFATHLLDRGADLNAIKELLGHTSLAATQVYVHNSIAKLKDVYRKAHPKA